MWILGVLFCQSEEGFIQDFHMKTSVFLGDTRHRYHKRENNGNLLGEKVIVRHFVSRGAYDSVVQA